MGEAVMQEWSYDHAGEAVMQDERSCDNTGEAAMQDEMSYDNTRRSSNTGWEEIC